MSSFLTKTKKLTKLFVKIGSLMKTDIENFVSSGWIVHQY
ncbi:hypothetical protein I580_01012 [Enterococcus caccae ATCC BAA-1240]|uniref:Uncharacterized protein n=1 Tax=Enterococcus caccae ATCC BAA-1240 TaxID=1158612 RepID=R3WQZ4_9ENTE|nr:hypothetical protein UC7_02299 [Enterococcus caccae ATCC BAA-1240]EOT68629.1 hypothetical protein I580_01012 [Enterococcus caccae ATCC BAA-1240]